jgi:hypothetical protein
VSSTTKVLHPKCISSAGPGPAYFSTRTKASVGSSLAALKYQDFQRFLYGAGQATPFVLANLADSPGDSTLASSAPEFNRSSRACLRLRNDGDDGSCRQSLPARRRRTGATASDVGRALLAAYVVSVLAGWQRSSRDCPDRIDVQVWEAIMKRASFSSMALGVLWPLAGPAAVRVPPALDLVSGPFDMRERGTPSSTVAERSAADDLLRAHAELSRLFPDETFSPQFLIRQCLHDEAADCAPHGPHCSCLGHGRRGQAMTARLRHLRAASPRRPDCCRPAHLAGRTCLVLCSLPRPSSWR